MSIRKKSWGHGHFVFFLCVFSPVTTPRNDTQLQKNRGQLKRPKRFVSYLVFTYRILYLTNTKIACVSLCCDCSRNVNAFLTHFVQLEWVIHVSITAQRHKSHVLFVLKNNKCLMTEVRVCVCVICVFVL